MSAVRLWRDTATAVQPKCGRSQYLNGSSLMVAGKCTTCSNATCSAHQYRTGFCSGTPQVGTTDGGHECVDRERPSCTAAASTSAPGSLPITGRYIRVAIGRPDILNLREVQAFTAAGQLIRPVRANLSSVEGQYSGGLCIDGHLHDRMCQTKLDPSPHLLVDYGSTVAIAMIVVYNGVFDQDKEAVYVDVGDGWCRDAGGKKPVHYYTLGKMGDGAWCQAACSRFWACTAYGYRADDQHCAVYGNELQELQMTEGWQRSPSTNGTDIIASGNGVEGPVCHRKRQMHYARNASVEHAGVAGCDSCAMRIVGGTISVERDPHGKDISWSSTFASPHKGSEDVYRFRLLQRKAPRSTFACCRSTGCCRIGLLPGRASLLLPQCAFAGR